MTDDELRSLIRAAVQRHLEPGSQAPSPKPQAAAPVSLSFAQYQIERAPGDSMCIIEPAVRCNHCGFCKCHGH